MNGHRTIGTCALWISSFLSTIDPNVGCDPRIPKDEIFSKTNPTASAARCRTSTATSSASTRRRGSRTGRSTTWACSTASKALNAGTITVDQFLDLNADIGGYDINGQITADREQATPAQMRRAYATGRVLSGGGNMREIPIITVNLYSDPYGDIHDRFRLFTIRERLRDKDGKIDANEVIWTRPSGGDIAAALTGNRVRSDRRDHAPRPLAHHRLPPEGGRGQLHGRDRQADQRIEDLHRARAVP